MAEKNSVIAFYDDRMLAHEPDIDVPFLPVRMDTRVRSLLSGLGVPWKYPEHPARLTAWLDVDTTAVSPGTGKIDEVGVGLGDGTIVNMPLPGDSGDAAYLKAFHEILVPVAEWFRPDLILVSTGFDPHCHDLAMNVSYDGFSAMTGTPAAPGAAAVRRTAGVRARGWLQPDIAVARGPLGAQRAGRRRTTGTRTAPDGQESIVQPSARRQ